MKISTTTKSIILGILIFSALGLVIGLFFVPDQLFYAIGVALGAGMSILKIYILERSVNKLTQADYEDVKTVKNLMRLGYTTRYLLTAIVFVAALLLMGTWGLVGTFVGTVAMTLSAVATRFFIKPDNGKNIN